MATERTLLDRAKEMRNNPTGWEVRVRWHLPNSRLGHKSRRQAAIFPYVCDFLYPAKALIVEIDGDTHDTANDARRGAHLQARGYTTLRFSNADVRENIEGVVLSIATALRQRPDRWSSDPPEVCSRPNP